MKSKLTFTIDGENVSYEKEGSNEFITISVSQAVSKDDSVRDIIQAAFLSSIQYMDDERFDFIMELLDIIKYTRSLSNGDNKAN